MKSRCSTSRSIISFVIATCLASSGTAAIYIGLGPISPYYAGPVYVNQQQQVPGQYVVRSRPLWLGQALFGPIVVFVPNQQQTDPTRPNNPADANTWPWSQIRAQQRPSPKGPSSSPR